MNQRSKTLAFAAVLGTLLSGSASAGTKIVKSWREPSAGPLQFKKVLVLCFAPHDSQQLFGEAELVKLMKRTQAVAAHTVMSADDVKDEAKMRAYMAREGFDGAVTLRHVGATENFSESGVYIPSNSGFWGYYSVWPGTYASYVDVDRKIVMETQVFSMKEDKLVWSGYSATTNPKSAQKLVEDVASAVASALRKQGLIE